MTVRAWVDKMINWYAKTKQPAPAFLRVDCRPATLAKFAKKQRRGSLYYNYRQHLLLATRKREA